MVTEFEPVGASSGTDDDGPDDRRNTFGTRRVAGALAITMTLALGIADPAAADAVFVPIPETGADGELMLGSSLYPLDIPSLSPGQSFSWQIRASVSDEVDIGSLEMEVDASGSRAVDDDGYFLTLEVCDQPWLSVDGLNATPACPGARTEAVRRVSLAEHTGEDGVDLPPVAPDRPAYVAFVLDLPGDSAQRPDEGKLDLSIRVTAEGDDPQDTGSPDPSSLPSDGGGAGRSGRPSGWSGSVDENGVSTVTGGARSDGPVTAPGQGGRADGRLSWTGFELVRYLAMGLGAVAIGVVLALVARRRAWRPRA
ncbi:hypothetical protein [Nakamurella leprariae]|uniref:Uncharacterized protein n=1 Tax=Nakamurella leprariae TaxID=2803911 RepID=A0A939BXI9_9ACTN|nr:hypothetical protein [Nakamurella leprariae]MBM9466030.1 hypothetical protein [Nakamurella leprariae]